VKSGKLRAFQPGRKYLIPASAVEELLRPKALGPSWPRLLLRNRAGHDFLTHSLADTVAFAEAASQAEIKARIQALAEEQAVLHEASRKPREYLPGLFGPPPSGKTLPHADIEEVKAAREEIKAVAKGFVVRVKVLAEIGGRKDETGDSKALMAEAERILETEHAAVLAEA
jgi:hypothetical protein